MHNRAILLLAFVASIIFWCLRFVSVGHSVVVCLRMRLVLIRRLLWPTNDERRLERGTSASIDRSPGRRALKSRLTNDDRDFLLLGYECKCSHLVWEGKRRRGPVGLWANPRSAPDKPSKHQTDRPAARTTFYCHWISDGLKRRHRWTR